MVFLLLLIVGVAVYAFIKAKARLHYERQASALEEVSKNTSYLVPSWIEGKERCEEFWFVVRKLAKHKGIPDQYIASSFHNKEMNKLLLSFANAMERRGSTFAEQQSASADLLGKLWDELIIRLGGGGLAAGTTSALHLYELFEDLLQWFATESPLGAYERSFVRLLELKKLVLGSAVYPEFYEPKVARLPKGIRFLTELEEVHLQFNNLDAIPGEIGSLRRLRDLKLGGNKIKALPPEIGNLRNLEILTLWRNKIEHLPKEIGLLGSLKGLSLRDNPLRSLPDTIVRLDKLRCLELDSMPNLVLTSEQVSWIQGLIAAGCDVSCDKLQDGLGQLEYVDFDSDEDIFGLPE